MNQMVTIELLKGTFMKLSNKQLTFKKNKKTKNKTKKNLHVDIKVFLKQNMSRNVWEKKANIKVLTVPESIWQELGGINKHFV